MRAVFNKSLLSGIEQRDAFVKTAVDRGQLGVSLGCVTIPSGYHCASLEVADKNNLQDPIDGQHGRRTGKANKSISWNHSTGVVGNESQSWDAPRRLFVDS